MPDIEPIASPPPDRRPGLRLADLVGATVGYGLASLLARSVWPGFTNLAGAPLVAFALEFAWLGLAMSGPVLLVFGRLGTSPPPGVARKAPPTRPARPGRPIGAVPVGERWAGPSRVVAEGPPTPDRVQWTGAELAWLGIGSYWISVTLFIAGVRSRGIPGPLASLIPVLAIPGLIVLVPAGLRRRATRPVRRWTNAVAHGLLWTWPIAWGLLVLLGRTL